MKPPAVEINNVSKIFQDVPAVKSVSLTINEGEFFSLLGPSGCGKTTLLRMIAGFEQPTIGAVRICGADMTDVPPHKRPVNMVFQSYALFPHLSVFDNVAFGLKVKKSCPESEIESRVVHALELVRLPQMIDRFPRELSGGQQQRVAFARAIVNQPSVLLLDEPLSALDPRIRQDMQTELARFKRELGITFVMVTHDQAEAFALSDRIAVLNAGCLEQVGTPEEIYERPRSAFVADFIGETNILSGIVAQTDGHYACLELDDKQQMWAHADMAASPGQPGVIWIRTESFILGQTESLVSGESLVPGHSEAPSDGGGPLNKLKAIVRNRSYQGNNTVYQLQAGELILMASVRNDHGEPFAIDSTVPVLLPARRAHLLVNETQKQPAPPVSTAVEV